MIRRKEENLTSQTRKRDLEQKINLRMEEELGNLYKSDVKARRTMSAGGRRIVGLVVILLVVLLVTLCLLPYGVLFGVLDGHGIPYLTYSMAEYRKIVIFQTSSLIEFITAGGAQTMGTVICSVLVVIASGYAMSVSGAVYQGLFNNPMASPTTMGVNAGGTLGGIFYILFVYDAYAVGTRYLTMTTVTADELVSWWNSMNIFQRCLQELCILAGCFLGVALILMISMAAGRGRISTVALLLAGSVFSTVISEVGQLLQYYYTEYGDEVTASALSTLIGGNSMGGSFSWSQLALMAVPIVLCSILVFSMSGKVNVIVFGEAEARTMGVNINAYRNALIVICTILSAVTLAFCGRVSMVGFIVPHFARYLVGPDFKKLIPASAILGGIVTLLVYDACYIMGQLDRFNLYTGVVCTILSAFFIIFYRRNRHADWS